MMTKMEIINNLKDINNKLRWYFVCCRRICNENYKLALYTKLQHLQSIVKWLSNENLYPKTDKYNKFKIYYSIYLLQMDKSSLSTIAKEEHLYSKQMQNVTYKEVEDILSDINMIKMTIFNEALCVCSLGEYHIIRQHLYIFYSLLDISKDVMPKEFVEVLDTISSMLVNFEKYLQNDENVQEDIVNSILVDILDKFSILQDYKNIVRTLEPIPASIVELAFDVYSQIQIMLVEYKKNKYSILSYPTIY